MSRFTHFKKIILTTAVTLAISSAAQAEQVLDYKVALAEDGQTYQVYMKPDSTPFADVNLTGQVTIKAPHLDGENAFKATNIKSNMDGILWVETSRIDAPKEAPFYDYISFSFLASDSSALRKFAWQAGEEKLMFSFENSKGCVEDVSLMANDDAFNVENNSANTNPGNQFTNLGWGGVSENNYRTNYGNKIVCSTTK